MNIIENFGNQDLRNINIGKKHGAQPEGSLQLCNAGTQQIKLMLKDKGDDWQYLEGNRGADALHFSGNGIPFQGNRYPYVELNPGDWVILKLPESNNQAFTIWPHSLCNGVNCLSGSNPTSQPGFYRVSGDWQKAWPSGGGYTICGPDNFCDENNPSAGATKIEGGKDMVSDISMVDGYNHSVKMEITTEINDMRGNVYSSDEKIVVNPQDCNYGIRNYAGDTSKGMIGCSNTFKDGNQKSAISWDVWNSANKPRYRDLTMEGQSGFCNFEQVPWNNCGYPCAEAANPNTQNWQGPCYAPSREYCKTIHQDNYPGDPPYYYGDKTQGKFTGYCFSHDDDNASPELKFPYKLKLTFGDGIVGKPFNNEGCNWSKGPCENPTPPANTAWYCTPENKCSKLLQRDHDPGYPTKEDCVRNSNCVNYAKNFHCENNVCNFHDNDNLQTLNECRSSCGGRPGDCKEGCDPRADPRAMCRSGKYCPGSGCCDHVAPAPPPPPPPERFDCVNGACVMNFLGSYPTRGQCEAGCGGNQPCQGNLCDPHSDPPQRCPNGSLCPGNGCCPI